tara:strand:- start:11638 stop:11907 length:270 start_codon:yes stop_codon:yes gene_type:complete
MNISEKTRINLTTKDMVSVIMVLGFVIGMYFSLKAQIEEAKELPIMDEQLKRAIVKTSAELEYIKTEIREIKSKLNTMEQRLYEINNNE